MVGYSYRKGDGSGLQLWHLNQTVPLPLQYGMPPEAWTWRSVWDWRLSFDLIYVGSNPTGENRCLVVKAIKRHLSRVSQRRKTWSLPACFDFRKEHGILRPPRKQNDCSISGQKKSVQQGACLYCLRRQNKPYPMVRSRELHTAPALCRALAQENQGEKIPWTESRISHCFVSPNSPQSSLRQIPGWNHKLTVNLCL